VGKDVSKNTGEAYRGIGITSPEYTHESLVRETIPTFTEANPRPGVASSKAKSGMVLDVSGEMKAVDTLRPELTLTTNRGGNPGAAQGRHTWTTNLPGSVGHETEFGWEAPNAIARSEVVYDGTANTVGGCLRTHVNTVLLPIVIGGAVFMFRKLFNSASHLSSGGVTWLPWVQGVPVFLIPGSHELIEGSACLLQLPEGRIHFYYMFKDSTVPSSPVGQLGHIWSDDDGASWSDGQKHILDTAIDMRSTAGAGNAGYSVDRARVAFSGDQVLLFVAGSVHNTTLYPTIRNACWQYASPDLGNSFNNVDISDDAVTVATGIDPNGALLTDGTGSQHIAAFHDIAASADGSGFVVSYSRVSTAAGTLGNVLSKRLGTSWTAWPTVTPVSVFVLTSIGILVDQLIVETNTSVAVDENGVLACTYVASPSSSATTRAKAYVSVSYDHGASWESQAGNFDVFTDAARGTWWDSGSIEFYPANFCSTFQCGRLLIITQFVVHDEQGGPSLDDTKIWAIDLGGYSTATRAFKVEEEKDHKQGLWGVNWLAGQLLEDTTGWASAGAGTELLNSLGYTTLTTGGGQTLTRTNAAIDAVSGGELTLHSMIGFRTRVGTGRLDIFIGDGVNAVNIYIEQDTTNITIKDLQAPATLYQQSDIDPTEFNQFYWVFDWGAKRISIWARSSASDTEARAWKPIVVYATVGTAASAAASRIGVDLPQNSTVDFWEINWGSGVYGRAGFRGTTAESHGYVATIYGRSWSPYPVHIHAGNGVRVAAVDGPSWDSDTWTITQRHEYGIENIFPSAAPSPRKTWRSRTYPGDIPAHVWRVRVGIDADPAPWLGRVLFIAGFNANFQTLEIEYRTNSAAGWTPLGVLDFSAGMQFLKFIRDGKIVRPATASGPTSADEHFGYNILSDSHFKLSNTEIRRVSTNSEGVWTDQTGLRTRLYCDDIDGTEPAVGAAGAVWMKDGVLIIRDCPDIYELRFTIPQGRTATGYYELGTLPVGHVAYFGRQYARGRALALEANYNLTTARSGTRRGQSLGPARRAVEFAWANENQIDHSQLAELPPNPDYILPALGSADPVATPADTDLKMAGLIEYLRGAVETMVYFARLEMVPHEGIDTTIVNRNLFMLARIMSDAQMEAILGDEWSSSSGEMRRMSKILAEEEV